jgi:kynurenine formamidase
MRVLLLMTCLALAAGVLTAQSPARAPAAPGAAAAPASPPPPLDLARADVVDLTHPFDEKTLYWPTAPSRFQLTVLQRGPTPAGYFYSANAFCTPEHGGTHLDAPIHFHASGRTVDELPVRDLIAPGVMLDVAAQAAAHPDYRLTPADVEAWEKEHGRIPERSIVLLRTGWSDRWPDAKRYLGDDRPGEVSGLHFPSYGKEAAELLVKERKVAALGVDTASIDYGASTDFAVHQVAAAANVPGLENLNMLGAVPPRGAWVVALPMKIARGSGAPLRVVALRPGLLSPSPRPRPGKRAGSAG